MSGGERERTGGAGRRPALLEAWERTVRRRGEARAVVEAATGVTCSFRELDARAEAWLAAQEVEAAELARRAVVFAVPNGVRWLEIFLGLVRAGAVIVPLDGAEPVEAQRRAAEAVRAGFWWDGARLQRLAGARRFHPEASVIKLTSGTTGRPRALVFTAAQMIADGRQVTATMGIRATDLNHALIPLGHSYGLGNLTLPLLAQGVPLVCGSSPLPQAIAAEVARFRPTVFPTVPAVLRALATADVSAEQLASLRTVISAGAPLPVETAQAFASRFGRNVHGFYGSSETGGIAYDKSGDATSRGGVGRAMKGVRIVARRGERIEVSSAAVFTSGNRLRAGRWGAWRPADRVAMSPRGEITLLGRQGEIVKIAGRRVSLAEVAGRLRRAAGVRDVWVGVSAGAEPVLGAAVAAARTAGELRAELLADTAPWKVPKKWAVLAELPLTARGKIDTRALHTAVFGARSVSEFAGEGASLRGTERS